MIRRVVRENVPAADRVVFVHARLRALRKISGLDYAELADAILDGLLDQSPRAVLVPTQTMVSFETGGVFSPTHTRSEEGRFSEEVRTRRASYRTPDPLFSVADVTGYLEGHDALDHTTMFGHASLYERLHAENALVVNIDLWDDLRICSHQPEYEAGVGYRAIKQVGGVVEGPDGWTPVAYQAWIRARDAEGREIPDYDRAAIRDLLDRAGVLHRTMIDEVPVVWMGLQESAGVLRRCLAADPECLVTSPS